MSNLKKVKITASNAKDVEVYSDLFGIFRNGRIWIGEVYVNKQWLPSGRVFYKRTKKLYERVMELSSNKIYEIFDIVAYTSAKLSDYINDSTAQEVKIDKIKVCFGDTYQNIIFDKKNIGDLKNMTVYISEDGSKINLVPANFSILKVGNRVYYSGAGTCTILHIYETNSAGKLCRLESIKDKKVYEISSGQRLYQLPYEPQNVFGFLNESLNESLLMPFIDGEKQTINVCWQGIEAASQYCVSLYRYFNVNNFRKVYHLNDFIVDRNTTYLAIPHLVRLEKLIVTVSAENREGEIIAKSHGMNLQNNGQPRIWREEE